MFIASVDRLKLIYAGSYDDIAFPALRICDIMIT
jgi:hypothetical protein